MGNFGMRGMLGSEPSTKLRRNHRMRVTKLLIGAWLLAAAPAALGDPHGKLIEELRQVGDGITEAMRAKNIDAMLRFYADDVISLPDKSKRIDGIEALGRWHEVMASSGMQVLEFDSEPTNAWTAGDQVIEVGTYTIKMSIPGAGNVEDVGKYMNVYVRDAQGKLKIKAETWNSDLNPMQGMMGGSQGG